MVPTISMPRCVAAVVVAQFAGTFSEGYTIRDRMNIATSNGWHFLDAYPKHHVAVKLAPGEQIVLDGSLEEPAWQAVPWAGDFVDIAQPLFPNFTLPEKYKTKVKMRWDDNYFYVGAEIGEPWVFHGSVHGSGASLRSDLPIGNSNVPYYDNDFEVFVDVSGTNHYYKEFEMNFNNATYDVMWRVPDGSQGVPCCSDNKCERWCQKSAWPGFKGTWSMFPSGRTQVSRIKGGWSAEMMFPIEAKGGVGGLLSGGPDWGRFHPSRGAKYWYVDFARAEHPFFTANANDFNKLCSPILKTSPTLLGTDQWSCYWEWVWQPLGGFRYMHNPDYFGIVQFETSLEVPACLNIEWPARYVLAQVYQAQVAYVEEGGKYAADLSALLSDKYCGVKNGCSVGDLRKVLGVYKGHFNLRVTTDNAATSCVRYGKQRNYTGGPCFTAFVKMTVEGSQVDGSIREDRYLDVKRSGNGCLKQGPSTTSIKQA